MRLVRPVVALVGSIFQMRHSISIKVFKAVKAIHHTCPSLIE